ncbi:MAG: ABC transporter ATP-binding protein [Chitinophagia bacterium]|nr:ABC transporter ATP-binding protein [Chitinophagia bacterium]
MKQFYRKVNFLLYNSHRRELVFIVFLLLIGMVLEAGGIGILVPALSFLLDSNLDSHPAIAKYVYLFFGKISIARLIFYGLIVMFIFFLFKSVFLVYSAYRQARFVNTLSRDLSKELFSGYLFMPYIFHLQKNSSELHRNIQIEILHFGGICLSALSLATELTTIFGICILFLYIEPFGAISVILFFGFFTYILNKITNTRIRNWGYLRQHFDGLANKILFEGLGGVKQIILSQNESFFIEKFVEVKKGKGSTDTKINTLAAVPRLYLELLAVGGVSIMVITIQFQHKPMTNLIPLIGIFMAAAFRLIPSINKIVNGLQTINYAEPILKVLGNEFQIIRSLNRNHAVPKTTVGEWVFMQKIDFKDVTFSYLDSDRIILNKINFSIKQGEFIGIIGTTGAGKSTLIDLLVGLLAPVSGDILIDGKNLNGIVSRWQQIIGYVPQTIYLTDDTLRSNIAFGISEDLIDDERINKALKIAQLADYIATLPDGLNTYVGERGVRLSGGERQRIGIARALYHDPPVIVLDEATSSLDNITEKEFMDAVNALHGLKTIIVIAHRLTTVEKCDTVYELQSGNLHSLKKGI